MKPSAMNKQRGQVFVIVALSLVMLIGAAGLAIDSGTGYLVKAKLNAAADAAAVAGARSVSLGNSWPEQQAEARAAAQKFFDANYPQDYLGSRAEVSEIQVGIDCPVRGQICVDVSARAEVPTTFMRIMGIDRTDITALASTVRKDIDLAFVVDTSGSLSAYSADLRRQTAAFLDRLSPSTDRVSLIHFANGAEVDQPIRTGAERGYNRPAMVSDVNGYRFDGYTNYAEGFWHARNQLNQIAPGRRSTMRAIVFFSDGTPNTFASFFRFAQPSLCDRAGSLSSDEQADGVPRGLWDHTRQATGAGGDCWGDFGIRKQLHPQALPQWYNAHDINDREFAVIADAPRPVVNDTTTNSQTYRNVNRVAKNLPEAMAARAREEGIYIFTLGLGNNLKKASGAAISPDDTGENLLKCMANANDAPDRCRQAGAGQPAGAYCHAADTADLQACYAMLAAQILRITR